MTTAGPAAFVLAIQAEPATRWAVSGEVRHARGRVRIQFSGHGAASRELSGAAVDFAVTLVAGERLAAAMIDAEGRRALSRISGAGSTVRLRRR